MSTGTVKFYDAVRGFGFITDSESNEEYFVHKSGLSGSIKKDDKVTFEVTQGKKGSNAVNVKVA